MSQPTLKNLAKPKGKEELGQTRGSTRQGSREEKEGNFFEHMGQALCCMLHSYGL